LTHSHQSDKKKKESAISELTNIDTAGYFALDRNTKASKCQHSAKGSKPSTDITTSGHDFEFQGRKDGTVRVSTV
jgi:hypothetical protein